MRKTANQAKISAQAEREKPALERCCQAAEAGFDRLTGLTKLFCGFMVPAISFSFLASLILQLSKEQKIGTMFNVHLHEFISSTEIFYQKCKIRK